jgi:ketosteroid isomerase-like protein
MAASLGACNPPPTAASAAKPAVDTAKIAEAVKADAAQGAADFNAHDATKSVSHDAPDVVGMFHGQPNVVGPAADLASTKKLFAESPDAHYATANESVDVAASGDMAIYRATYTYTMTDPKTKKQVTETGNDVVGYKPQADGSWKVAWSIGADTPAATAQK